MLYLITNRNLVRNLDYFEVIERAIDGGLDGIILREKDLSTEELEPIARRIKEIIDRKFPEENRNKTRLIINSNREVAERIDADGYHMTFNDFMNRKEDYKGLLGVSVHSLEEAIRAENNGADYVLASHVFRTDCKKGLEPRGIEFIREIKEKLGIPVIALGGINHDNAYKVMEVGVEGIAVMSYIMASEEPFRATRLIKSKIL